MELLHSWVVVADGRFYTKCALDEAIVRHHRKFTSWLYDRITMLLARALARPMTDRGSAGDPHGPLNP